MTTRGDHTRDEDAALPADDRLLPNGILLDDYLPYLMNRVIAQANAKLAAKLADLGLTFQNWRVLLVLSQRGALPVMELARQTVVPQSTLSRVLARMERDGLVARSGGNGDGRVVEVRLSDAGMAAFEKAFPLSVEEEERLLAGFTAAERRAILGVLKRMRVNEAG